MTGAARDATGVAILLAVLLAACDVVMAPPEVQTWVGVYGPADAEPPEELVLEVGNGAWDAYGGVVMVTTSAILPVRLVGRDTCRVYATFLAPAGSMWVIRLEGDAMVTVQQVDDIEDGPAVGEVQPSGCADVLRSGRG